MDVHIIFSVRVGRGDDTRTWGPPFMESESVYFMSVNRNKKVPCLFRDDHAVALRMGKQLPHTQLVFLWHSFVSLDYTPSTFQLQSITINLKSDRGQEIVRKVSVSCIFLVVMYDCTCTAST